MTIPALIGVAGSCQPFSMENRGNFLHAMAARRLIGEARIFPTAQIWTDEQMEVLTQHRHLVCVMANAIRLGQKDAPFAWHSIGARNIEKSSLETVVFGLGAQAPIKGKINYTIPKETMRLLKVLGERSKKIAVRGFFTAEVLNRFGIKNVEPLGCQSAIWHGEKFPFALKVLKKAERVAFNYTHAAMEAKMIEWGVNSDFTMIGQSEVFEEHAAAGKYYDSHTVDTLFEKTDLTNVRYREWCIRKFKTFTNIYDWMNFLSDFDFNYGTRFHGNMTSIQSGVSALWVVHDMRTKELCDFMSLPHISMEEYLNTTDIDSLKEKADFSGFLGRYRSIFCGFRDYARNAGIGFFIN